MPRLRKRLGDLRAGLIAYQIELRSLASRKFRNPERWLWTRTLLEQAAMNRVPPWLRVTILRTWRWSMVAVGGR